MKKTIQQKNRTQGKHLSKMTGKAQIKMGETIAILFIFFILLVIGAVFYLNISRSSMTRQIEESYELRSIEQAQMISFLPELQCSDSNVVKASCFDIYKAAGLAAVREKPKAYLLYSREFENTEIKVVQIYPPGGEYVIYSNPKAQFSSAPVSHIPISLYNASSDSYAFGVLEITNYQ